MKHFLCILTIICSFHSLEAQTRFDQAPPSPPQPQGQLGWVRVPIDTNLSIAIGYVSKDTCYCANQHSFYRSLDAGRSWQQIHWTPNPSSFKFIDGSNGIVSYFSTHTCFRTTNGGTLWNQADNQLQQALYIDMVTPDTAYIAGSNDISHTYDGGKTWSSTSVAGPGIYGIAFRDGLHGIVVGEAQPGPLPHHELTAGCFTTSDGGKTWTQHYTGITSALEDVVYIGVDSLIAVGAPNKVNRSFDGGKTWDSVSIDVPGCSSIAHAHFRTLATAGDVILCSIDGGKSWQHQLTGLTSPLLAAIRMFNDSLAIASGQGGVILRTGNGGTDWVQIAPPAIEKLEASEFQQAETPNIEIVYLLPQMQNTTVTVCDLQGREIARLEKGTLRQAGSNHILFNSASVPSGTYHYEIATNRYTASGKFVVMHGGDEFVPLHSTKCLRNLEKLSLQYRDRL